MSKPFTTPSDIGQPAILDAAALDEAGLRARVLTPGGFWSALDVVAETGSTNEDLLAAARSGAAHGTVLAAEAQTRGRGRQGRRWTSPAGRPDVLGPAAPRPGAARPAEAGSRCWPACQWSARCAPTASRPPP